MTSRICSPSCSVSCDTRRASGIPTFPMISLAFFGPIPWIYCNAITTRLLVGMLTPAMRATVNHSFCRRRGRRSCHTRRFANDNATPSPFRRARYRSTSRLGWALLMDSSSFRQPPRRAAFAPGSLAGSAFADPRFGHFSLAFRRLSRPACLRLRCSARGRRPLGRRFLRPRLPEQPIDGARHLWNRGHTVDRPQHALKLVIGDERRGLIAVGRKPAPEHFRIIVLAKQLASRLHLGDALLDALEQDALVHLELDDRVELEALLLEHAIKRVRLRHRAREAIEDEAVARIGLVDALGDDRYHHVVGHELAARHHLLGAQPNRGARLDRGAQHVTGRKLQQTMLGDEPLRLSTFAGPRRAEQHQPHLRRPRSFDRLIRPSYWWASK